MSQLPVTNLVSVIIPAFNRVKYIKDTIESALGQIDVNVEVIVVDDGSADGTYDLLLTYLDKIKLLTHAGHKNQGQSASINLGLSVASGEFIAILDSDDLWESNKLSKQVCILNKNKDIGLVYSNGYAINDHGKVLYPIHKKNHLELCDPNRVLLDCYLALPVNSLVRRTVYEKVGKFDESFRAAQDHDMLIRMAEVTRFFYIPDFLWYYRKHEDSISVKNKELRWKTGFEILNRAVNRYPYTRSTIRKRAAVLNFRLGHTYWQEKKYLKSLLYLFKSSSLDPARAFNVLIGKEKIH